MRSLRSAKESSTSAFVGSPISLSFLSQFRGSSLAGNSSQRRSCPGKPALRRCSPQRTPATPLVMSGPAESSPSGGTASALGRPPRVLMVCLGNICRSPAAEAVLRAYAERRGLDVEVDSCGTGGGSPDWCEQGGFSYHEGDPGDSRMRATAEARGYDITSRSRPLRPDDMEGDGKFDMIVGMDRSNLAEMERARKLWEKEGRVAVDSVQWRMLSEFSSDESFRGRPVPDPYYGGSQGFEHALDLVEGACEGILDELFGEGAVGSSKK